MKEIASKHDKNFMTADNLSICLAPNILKPQKETMDTILCDESSVRGVVHLFFSEPEVIFQV